MRGGTSILEQRAPIHTGSLDSEGVRLPPAAGLDGIDAERDIARRLILGLHQPGTVLDLGSEVEFWTEEYARHFAKVVAVEGSTAVCRALRTRCPSYPTPPMGIASMWVLLESG